MNDTIQNIISQAIDLHYHIGPEVIPRKYSNISDLVRDQTGKISGLALKNHFYPTQPLISAARQTKAIRLIGGIVLNNFVGGLNNEAIYASSLLTNQPIIVWLPTIHAKEFLDNSPYEVAPEWVGKKKFRARMASKILPVDMRDTQRVKNILTVIKQQNAILATGHISWRESVSVVKRALDLGIKKIIITHPIYQRINFPLAKQKSLAKQGVIMEHCYSMYSIDKIPIAKIADSIKQVGPENCILSSDVGQSFSPDPSSALTQFSILLKKRNISERELVTMLVNNPRKLISKAVLK